MTENVRTERERARALRVTYVGLALWFLFLSFVLAVVAGPRAGLFCTAFVGVCYTWGTFLARRWGAAVSAQASTRRQRMTLGGVAAVVLAASFVALAFEDGLAIAVLAALALLSWAVAIRAAWLIAR